MENYCFLIYNSSFISMSHGVVGWSVGLKTMEIKQKFNK